jgi:multiple sugar transport system substrate-binding protein
MAELRGTTWAHTRAIAPLAAASQWHADTQGGVPAVWFTHSARQFGEGPVDQLAADFDLVCFDHPHAGHIAHSRIFLPLDEHLSEAELSDRKSASTGHSFASYACGGHQWGIPIDAAGTMSACNPAKLDALSIEMPGSWDALIRMAAAHPGLVVQPFSRMTTTAIFFSISVSLSNQGPQRLDGASFEDALARLAQLHKVSHGGYGFQLGSIDVLKLAMQAPTPVAIVPFAYPYSCFARMDLLAQPLRFGPHPTLPGGGAWHGVLGGAGIAVSARSGAPMQALSLLRWLTSRECQSTFFGVCLGQPADRRAWMAAPLNITTQDFYIRGLGLLDAAWLRPTDVAFHAIQGRLADTLHSFLAGNSAISATRLEVASLLAPYIG